MRGEYIFCTCVEFLTVLECKVEKKVNTHGRAILYGYISAEEEKLLLNRVMKAPLEQIYVLDERGEKHCFFTGVVEELKIEVEGEVKKARISFISGTILLDLKPNTRVFQDISMSYNELFRVINQEYSDAQTFLEGDEAIGEFTVQYEETDWEFMKRIASRIGTVLIPFFKFGQIRCSIGIIETGQKKELSFSKYSTNNYIKEYRKEKQMGSNHLIPADAISYQVTSRELLDLGDSVIFENHLVYVYEMQSQLEKGELLHTYLLRTKGAFSCSRKNNKNIIGASFDATVLDIKQDKIKVRIKAEGKQEKESARWFPFSTIYSSPDGTGWFCMPEIGDHMRLYFPNEIEKNAYVISAVHEEIPKTTLESYEANQKQPPRSNPDNKSIMNKYQKEVELTPTSITLTNHKGMMIRLDDEEGIQIISDKDIKVESTKELSLSSKEESLSIEGKEEIKLVQGSTKMILKDEITVEGAKMKLQ